MRAFYDAMGVIPTSHNADVMLIRSHVAYHMGNDRAERVVITAGRGHGYNVRMSALPGAYKLPVRISDYYDHRGGITGLTGH